MTHAGCAIDAAVPGDSAALGALKLTCFRETFLEDFAIPYPPSELAAFEAESYGLARVAAELADTGRRNWLVRNGTGALIGYAQVGPCKLPNSQVRPGEWELCQLYLRRSAQGRGLGQRLLDHVLDWLGTPGGPVWLGVWSGNARARALYEGRGFAVVGQHHFYVGSWRDEELTMRRDALPVCGGEDIFAPL